MSGYTSISDGDSATPDFMNSRLEELHKSGTQVFNVKHPDYDAAGDGETNDESAVTSAANDAANVNGTLFFPEGTYLGKFDFSQSGITILVGRGATFKLPDNEITGSDTSGSPAVDLSGSNIDVKGTLRVDGNASNQSTGSLTDANRPYTFQISGDHISMETIEIVNAYYDGFGIEKTDAAECEDISIDRILVDNPANRAGLIWSVDGFEIGTIVVTNVDATEDHRLRIGTAASSSAECLNGYIGRIRTVDNAVIIEEGAKELVIDSAHWRWGKTENCTGITIGSIRAADNVRNLAYSFSVQGSSQIQIGSVRVTNHGGATDKAVSFQDGATDVQIGRLSVYGSTADIQMEITSIRRLDIGSLILKDGSDRGGLINEDAGFDQGQIHIGTLVAQGNAGSYDFRHEFGVDDVHIGYHNVENFTGSQLVTGAAGHPLQIASAAVFDVAAGDGSITTQETFNVASISENTTGDYSVTFSNQIHGAAHQITARGTVQTEVTDESGTLLRFETSNSSGDLTRPTRVYAVSHQIGN